MLNLLTTLISMLSLFVIESALAQSAAPQALEKVTPENYIRAETDRNFENIVKLSANPEPLPRNVPAGLNGKHSDGSHGHTAFTISFTVAYFPSALAFGPFYSGDLSYSGEFR